MYLYFRLLAVARMRQKTSKNLRIVSRCMNVFVWMFTIVAIRLCRFGSLRRMRSRIVSLVLVFANIRCVAQLSIRSCLFIQQNVAKAEEKPKSGFVYILLKFIIFTSMRANVAVAISASTTPECHAIPSTCSSFKFPNAIESRTIGSATFYNIRHNYELRTALGGALGSMHSAAADWNNKIDCLCDRKMNYERQCRLLSPWYWLMQSCIFFNLTVFLFYPGLR